MDPVSAWVCKLPNRLLRPGCNVPRVPRSSRLGPVALYEITPNQFRGPVIAFYLLSVTLLGLGIGVTLIAAVNDFLFRDEMAIGSSISLVLVIAAAIGVAALHIARRPVNA
jgi:hypothetical protein